MRLIYANYNAKAAVERHRQILAAEIVLLRKFEGRQMIEERIAKNMQLLHGTWFGKHNAK